MKKLRIIFAEIRSRVKERARRLSSESPNDSENKPNKMQKLVEYILFILFIPFLLVEGCAAICGVALFSVLGSLIGLGYGKPITGALIGFSIPILLVISGGIIEELSEKSRRGDTMRPASLSEEKSPEAQDDDSPS